jgi:hypothetical protein
VTRDERISRLERAVAELAYLHDGPRALAMFRRQAPSLAAIFQEYLTGTEPAHDQHFAGRRETTVQPDDKEKR